MSSLRQMMTSKVYTWISGAGVSFPVCWHKPPNRPNLLWITTINSGQMTKTRTWVLWRINQDGQILQGSSALEEMTVTLQLTSFCSFGTMAGCDHSIVPSLPAFFLAWAAKGQLREARAAEKCKEAQKRDSQGRWTSHSTFKPYSQSDFMHHTHSEDSKKLAAEMNGTELT